MDQRRANKSSRAHQIGILSLLALLFWGGAFGLLTQGDALDCEFGGHPDEASHYVSGLMVYDYLSGHLGEHPLSYAETYYDFYPKVAIGHFPPGFYFFEALWFFVSSGSVASVLSFQCFVCGGIASLLAFIVYIGGGGRLVSLGVGVVFCALPLIQRYSGMVMSDLLLGLFCLLSCLAFAWYLQRPSMWSSFLFGCLAATSIMVKGSGLMLAFVPPISLILSRRYELFRARSFWVAVIPVLVICLPWMLLTYKITEEGMVQEWSPKYVAQALPYFAKQMYRTFGFVLVVLMGFGLRCSLKGRVAAGRVPELSAVMLALPVGLILTYILIPVGFEQRYLIPAVAPALYFMAIGFGYLHRLLSDRWAENWKANLVMACLLVGHGAEIFEVPVKRFQGFQSFVEAMGLKSDVEGKKILISSDSRGEGAVVAAVAMIDERPRHRVLRGSKVLSSSDWMGRGYSLAHTNAAALVQFVKQDEIDWVVVDASMQTSRIMDHNLQLEDVVKTHPAVFSLVEEREIQRKYWGRGRKAALYRVIRNAGAGGEDESEQH